MTAPKKPPVHRVDCGKLAGWNAHQRHNEYQCEDCTKAKTEHTREWRWRTGRTKQRLITRAELEALLIEAKAEALREAADEYDEHSEQFAETAQNMTKANGHTIEDMIRYGAYASAAQTTANTLRTRAKTIERTAS